MKYSKLKSSLVLCIIISGAAVPITHAGTLPNTDKLIQSSSLKAANETIPWNGLTLTLDSDGTLTIPSGTATLTGNIATAMAAVGADSTSVTSIIISGPLTLKGDASNLFYGFSNVTTLTGLDTVDVSYISSMSNMFSGFTELTSLDVSNFVTSNVRDMSKMFQGMKNLKSLDVSNFDTSKVTNMGGMFWGTNTLTNLDVSNFDTSKVTDMSGMLASPGVTSLDVSHFDTSNVTHMKEMFANTVLLNSLDVSNFNTSKVTDMGGMFRSAGKLSSLDVSNFDTSEVTNMNLMFANTYNLKTLDMSNFDTSNVTDMSSMFLSANSLNFIKLGTMFNSLSGTGLPDIPVTGTETGKWQNVGNGTVNHPKGKNIWSSADFMTYFTPSFADTYVWQPVTGKAITVKYQDDAGNKLGDDIVLNGNFQEDYTTDKKIFAGYTFKEVSGNSAGQFTMSPQIVTYTYTKDTPITGGNVTVKYEDGSGKSLSNSVVLKGNVGDKYTSNKKDISGYTYQKIEGNVNGTFTSNTQTVTYVYAKNTLPTSKVAVYRAYNPNSGEHVYTVSKYEYDSIIKEGWRGEGVAWLAPSAGIPTYRAYNPNSGEHFYTTSLYEYNDVTSKGWRKEGVAFYSDENKGTPIYRAFNPNATGPGSHFYTTSAYEYSQTIKAGWSGEGIRFYAAQK